MKHFAAILIILMIVFTVQAQTSEFTYQGRLDDSSIPATGTYLLQFRLYDAAAAGTQIGTTLSDVPATVVNGIFTVRLDFGGAAFSGAQRFVEISVKRNAGDAYTMLSPRQSVTSTPYAVRALNASTADTAVNSTQLGGIPANQFTQTNDPRLTDERNPLAGSPNYIQNTASQQTGANFNISGNGTAGGTLSGNTVNAATEFDLGGNRILSMGGTHNLFAGIAAGQSNLTGGTANSFFGFIAGASNTTGSFNSFYGSYAGAANTTAINNSFFGQSAGMQNTTGNNNTFIGNSAGFNNSTANSNTFVGSFSGFNTTTGFANSFFGTSAGFSNTTGMSNSFFGFIAGNANSTGENNSFFGYQAGSKNTTAAANSFFGSLAGTANTVGTANSFFGFNAGAANTTGISNSFFGSGAGAANMTAMNNAFFGQSAGLVNTTGQDNTFIGNGAGSGNTTANYNTFVGSLAGQSNSTGAYNAFLGFQAGNVNQTGKGNSFFGFQSGFQNTTGDYNSFFGQNSGKANTTGFDNAFFGNATGVNNLGGQQNSFFGIEAGFDNTSGSLNTFIGELSGEHNTTGSQNTFIGAGSGVPDGTGNLQQSTALGAFAKVTTSNTIVLGTSAETTQIPGKLAVSTLGSAGSTNLCRNASNQISTCSSSLRYKTNIADFNPGLALVKQLRPITFDWKDGGMHDVGLGAEDVAKVDELLVIRNEKGEVEGVKYDRIGVVLVNAVNEQQKEIETEGKKNAELLGRIELQQKQLDEQKAVIEGLKKLLCRNNVQAEVCK
jgi:hypothetical protein